MSLAIVLAMTLSAAQAPTFRDPPACWDGSQHEMNVCASKEYQQADAAMNSQWKQTAALMKRLDADDPPNPAVGQSSNFDALVAGQRAWLAYRDAYCPIFGTGGGSMKPMLIDICLRDVTRLRTEQLKGLMLNPVTGNSYYEDQ